MRTPEPAARGGSGWDGCAGGGRHTRASTVTGVSTGSGGGGGTGGRSTGRPRGAAAGAVGALVAADVPDPEAMSLLFKP